MLKCEICKRKSPTVKYNLYFFYLYFNYEMYYWNPLCEECKKSYFHQKHEIEKHFLEIKKLKETESQI